MRGLQGTPEILSFDFRLFHGIVKANRPKGCKQLVASQPINQSSTALKFPDLLLFRGAVSFNPKENSKTKIDPHTAIHIGAARLYLSAITPPIEGAIVPPNTSPTSTIRVLATKLFSVLKRYDEDMHEVNVITECIH